MVTFRAEYGDLPTLSLAKVSSLSGVSVAEHHVLALEKACRPPNFQQWIIADCLLWSRSTQLTGAVKSLDRSCCKDEVTSSASSPQGKREDGTYSTHLFPRGLEKGVCHPVLGGCIQVQKELMEKTSLLEAPHASFSAWRPVRIGN